MGNDQSRSNKNPPPQANELSSNAQSTNPPPGSQARLSRKNLDEKAQDMLDLAVQKLPFHVTSEQHEQMLNSVEQLEVDVPGLVVTQGQTAVGLYFVVDGLIEVVSKDESVVFREIEEGDFFGEVSIFFDQPCTANVKVSDAATLLLLKKGDCNAIFPKPPETTLIRWFLQRKYTDTSKLFQENKLSKELMFNAFKEAPMLHNWSDEALNLLVESASEDGIVLFPKDSAISREGDRGSEAFFLIQGKVLFSTNNEAVVVFNSGKLGFCFGEEGLFLNSERRSTVSAETPCQVVSLTAENFFKVLNQFSEEASYFKELSNKWKAWAEERSHDLYFKYGGRLDLEIMRMSFRKSDVFKSCPPGFLYQLALSSVVMEISEGGTVLRNNEIKYTMFIILEGNAELMDSDQPTEYRYQCGQVFWYLPEMMSSAWVRAVDSCVVGVFPYRAVTEAQAEYTNAVINKPVM